MGILTDLAIREQFCLPGVYIWVETLPTGKRQLSYVGKATLSTTLWGRHLQHYASLVGGLYSIPKEFGDGTNHWVPDWSKRDVASIMLEESLFLKVVEAGFKRAVATEIYLCPLSGEVDLAAIERQLLYELKPSGTKRGTMSPPKVGLEIEHQNIPWCVRVKDKIGSNESSV